MTEITQTCPSCGRAELRFRADLRAGCPACRRTWDLRQGELYEVLGDPETSAPFDPPLD